MTDLTGPETAEPSLADLLTTATCSPGCLLAQPDGTCTCRCAGAHHGAALKALTSQTTHPPTEGETP